jgi:hypothetical protein
MRTHRVFPTMQPWSWRTEQLRELVSAELLVAARLEPVTRGRQPTAFLDLHFSDGERTIAIPLVYVDIAQFDVRELDPLVFPHQLVGIVPDAHVREVVERLFPDLERRAVNGGFWSEEVIRYGDAAIFDAARAQGFFAAAPLATALPRIAAAVYARRFSNAKHVLTYGANAIELAGFFGSAATSCTVLGDDSEASAYFGAFEPGAADGSYDLAIGSGPPPAKAAIVVRTDAGAAEGLRIGVGTPLPADVMLSFGAAGDAAVGTFSVTTSREPFLRPVPDIEIPVTVGGSAGRIGVVVRPDAAGVPDSDTDEAAALAQALRAEGFTAEVVSGIDALEAFGPDLVHLYGVRPGGFARQVAEWAADHRKPLAVHALYESPAAGGYWGAMAAPYCFTYSGDDRNVGAYLEMLARRAVEIDGVSAMVPFAPPLAGLADSERVLALADVVLVDSQREWAAVDALRPRRLTLVVPPQPTVSTGREPIGALVGVEPFVLVHAPICPDANQLMLARAAAEVRVPVVLAGAIGDPAYAERLREFAPENVSLIGEPSAAALATLYRTATVIADAAWTTRGHGRLLTAAALGATVVCSLARWIELPAEGRWIVDPADVASIARGIGEAWDASMRSDPGVQATASFARDALRTAAPAMLAAYSQIVQAV